MPKPTASPGVAVAEIDAILAATDAAAAGH